MTILSFLSICPFRKFWTIWTIWTVWTVWTQTFFCRMVSDLTDIVFCSRKYARKMVEYREEIGWSEG